MTTIATIVIMHSKKEKISKLQVSKTSRFHSLRWNSGVNLKMADHVEQLALGLATRHDRSLREKGPGGESNRFLETTNLRLPSVV